MATETCETLNTPEAADSSRRFYNPAELCDLTSAAEYAKRCKATISLYGKRHGIAWPVRGRTVVSVIALQMLLEGDFATLERWRSGEVEHPDVRFYYDRLNIALPATAATAG